MYAILTRIKTSEDGTFGVLALPELGFSCYTAEPAWRDNQRSISCIPKGEYDVELRYSPSRGLVFHVKDVPGRSYILIHAGNFASTYKRTDTEGCILIGDRLGVLAGLPVVLNSRLTLKKMMRLINGKGFKLTIC